MVGPVERSWRAWFRKGVIVVFDHTCRDVLLPDFPMGCAWILLSELEEL